MPEIIKPEKFKPNSSIWQNSAELEEYKNQIKKDMTSHNYEARSSIVKAYWDAWKKYVERVYLIFDVELLCTLLRYVDLNDVDERKYVFKHLEFEMELFPSFGKRLFSSDSEILPEKSSLQEKIKLWFIDRSTYTSEFFESCPSTVEAMKVNNYLVTWARDNFDLIKYIFSNKNYRLDKLLIQQLLETDHDPIIYKKLTEDIKSWEMLLNYYDSANDGTKKKFLKLSPWFFSKMHGIDPLDLLLNREFPNGNKRYSDTEIYKTIRENFWKIFNKRIDEYIVSDEKLKRDLLCLSTARELRDLSERSMLIIRESIASGYLEKLFPLGENHRNLSILYIRYVMDEKNEIDDNKKNYVIEFFRSRIDFLSLHKIAVNYPDYFNYFFSETKLQQNWLLAPDGTTINIYPESNISDLMKVLLNKFNESKLGHTLLQTAIYFSKFNDKKLLEKLLKYKPSFLGNSTEDIIRFYICLEMNNVDKNRNVNLEFKYIVEQVLKNEIILQEIQFTGTTYLVLFDCIKELDPNCYKVISGSEEVWRTIMEEIDNKIPPAKRDFTRESVRKLSPYFYIRAHFSGENTDKIGIEGKIKYLACLILDRFCAQIIVKEKSVFSSLRKEFLCVFPQETLNALLEKDNDLRRAILYYFMCDQIDTYLKPENSEIKIRAETEFSNLIKYSNLIPDLLYKNLESNFLKKQQLDVLLSEENETIINCSNANAVEFPKEELLFEKKFLSMESQVVLKPQPIKQEKITVEEKQEIEKISSLQIPVPPPLPSILEIKKFSFMKLGEKLNSKIFLDLFENNDDERYKFIKEYFGCDFSKLNSEIFISREEYEKEMDMRDKNEKLFEESIAPVLGEITEKIRSFEPIRKEDAWEIFSEKADFSKIKVLQNTDVLERKKFFYEKKFSLLFEKLHDKVQIKYANFALAVYPKEEKEKKSELNAIMTDIFGYKLKFETIKKIQANNDSWSYHRDRFNIAILPWLGRLLAQLQKDKALTMEVALKWFLSHVKETDINFQGRMDDAKVTKNLDISQFKEAFKIMFEQLKRAAETYKGTWGVFNAASVKAFKITSEDIASIKLKPTKTNSTPPKSTGNDPAATLLSQWRQKIEHLQMQRKNNSRPSNDIESSVFEKGAPHISYKK